MKMASAVVTIAKTEAETEAEAETETETETDVETLSIDTAAIAALLQHVAMHEKAPVTPLPAGWEVRHTRSTPTKTYFHCPLLRHNTWHRPTTHTLLRSQICAATPALTPRLGLNAVLNMLWSVMLDQVSPYEDGWSLQVWAARPDAALAAVAKQVGAGGATFLCHPEAAAWSGVRTQQTDLTRRISRTSLCAPRDVIAVPHLLLNRMWATPDAGAVLCANLEKLLHSRHSATAAAVALHIDDDAMRMQLLRGGKHAAVATLVATSAATLWTLGSGARHDPLVWRWAAPSDDKSWAPPVWAHRVTWTALVRTATTAGLDVAASWPAADLWGLLRAQRVASAAAKRLAPPSVCTSLHTQLNAWDLACLHLLRFTIFRVRPAATRPQ